MPRHDVRARIAHLAQSTKCHMIVLGAFTEFERFMSGDQQVVDPMVERFGGRYALMGSGSFQGVLVDAEGIAASP